MRRRASTRWRVQRPAWRSSARRAEPSSTRSGRPFSPAALINNTQTGPLVDGDRRMAYTWAFSVGVKRELVQNMAVSVDYVGNRGRDNTGTIDINEGPVNPATGRVTRLGVDVFDPDWRTGSPARRAAPRSFSSTRTRRRSSGRRWTPRSTRWRSDSRNATRTAGQAASATRSPIATTSGQSSSTVTPGSTTAAATATTCTRSPPAPTWTSGRGLAPGSCSAPIRATRSTKRSARTSTQDGTNNDRPTKGVNDLARLAIGSAGRDRVCRGLERRRGPQRDRWRGEDHPRRPVPVHPTVREGFRPGSSSRSTTC